MTILQPLKSLPPVTVAGHHGGRQEVAIMVKGADDRGMVILTGHEAIRLGLELIEQGEAVWIEQEDDDFDL
jgi:hypothetical protein